MDDNGISSVPEIALLSCREVFATLTVSEQIYAHHLARQVFSVAILAATRLIWK